MQKKTATERKTPEVPAPVKTLLLENQHQARRGREPGGKGGGLRRGGKNKTPAPYEKAREVGAGQLVPGRETAILSGHGAKLAKRTEGNRDSPTAEHLPRDQNSPTRKATSGREGERGRREKYMDPAKRLEETRTREGRPRSF